MNSLNTSRVLVTPTSYAKNDPKLRTELEAQVGEVVYNTAGHPLSAEELVPLISGIDGYIAGLDAITREVLEAADSLKVIARYGVGVDAIDLETARQKGIVITNTPGANSASVAELTLGLMLSLARNIPEAVEATRSGEWPRFRGMSLGGKTIGLFGFGEIGKRVAQMLKGFNARLVAYDPFPDVEFAEECGVEIVQQDEVIRMADILSLHCPVLPDTRGMVNTDFIRKMKPGAFLINTSRGELINEDALYDAIKSNHLQGAALDVFSQQPPQPGNPLLGMPQVIVTPHMGAHTDGATNAMGWAALNDCLAVLRGEEPLHRVV